MKKLTSLSLAARQRGVSLIEGVLYLVIALAVIVGGIVFFQQAQLSNNVTDTARAGVGISSQVRGLYQNQRDFGTADLTAAVIAAGAAPSNFLNAAGDGLVHPFDGEILVKGANEEFALVFTDMSAAACVRLGTVGNDGSGPLGTGIMGYRFVRDWSTASIDFGSANRGFPPPVTSADVATDCLDGTSLIMYYSR